MIVTTKDGKTIDTGTDLTPPERHVLQKLFLWKSMASSLDEFRLKVREALAKGWNNSGPIRASPALQGVISELENKVRRRLEHVGGP
ncbi:MAG: hypothetical protein JW821_01415 [Deltaproteobacteria bacterium]|nr:hypothetical protein [Deltaproteobacteria bacterium]